MDRTWSVNSAMKLQCDYSSTNSDLFSRFFDSNWRTLCVFVVFCERNLKPLHWFSLQLEDPVNGGKVQCTRINIPQQQWLRWNSNTEKIHQHGENVCSRIKQSKRLFGIVSIFGVVSTEQGKITWFKKSQSWGFRYSCLQYWCTNQTHLLGYTKFQHVHIWMYLELVSKYKVMIYLEQDG